MKEQFTISIFTENKVGLLHRVTIIFTRRHINIESITASESEVKGIYRYTIVVLKLVKVLKNLLNKSKSKLMYSGHFTTQKKR